MKTINKYLEKMGAEGLFKIWHLTALAIIAGSFTFFVFSCQQLSEPNDPKAMVFTVISEDQTGARVPGARVFLGVGAADSLIYQGDTDINGVFVIPLNIPCQGMIYTVRVEPPFNNPDYTGTGCLDTINLTCCDYTYYCRNISKTLITTSCSSELKEFDIEKIICLDTANTARAASSVIQNQTQCDWRVNVSSASPAIPQGLTVNVSATSTPGPIALPSNFTLPASGSFYIDCNMNTADPIAYHGIINIIATCEGTGDTCFIGRINLNFEALYCDDCACPKDSVIRLRYIDTVCVTDLNEFTLPLEGIYNYENRTSECRYVFNLAKTFTSKSINLSKFNGSNPSKLTLNPGDGFENIVIDFTPADTGRYLDTAVYEMTIINTFDKEIQCGVQFVVIFDVVASGPECYITPLSIPNITQCVDKSETQNNRYFIIENRGECPLGPVTITLSGASAALFDANPKTLTIPPNSRDTVYIEFYPTKTDVWPNGYGTKAVVDFYAALNINSPSASCSINNYNLHGVADTTCGSGYICMREYGRNGNNEGIIINDKYDFTVSQNIDVSIFDIYAEPVNVGAQQATLRTGKGGEFKLIQNAYGFTGGNLCFEANQDVYDECNSSLPGQSAIVVSPRDLLLLKYPSGECALIWIDNIFSTSTNPQDYVICFYICTKI